MKHTELNDGGGGWLYTDGTPATLEVDLDDGVGGLSDVGQTARAAAAEQEKILEGLMKRTFVSVSVARSRTPSVLGTTARISLAHTDPQSPPLFGTPRVP